MGRAGRTRVLVVCSYGRDVVVTDGKGRVGIKELMVVSECVGRGKGM